MVVYKASNVRRGAFIERSNTHSAIIQMRIYLYALPTNALPQNLTTRAALSAPADLRRESPILTYQIPNIPVQHRFYIGHIWLCCPKPPYPTRNVIARESMATVRE
jgi:hypothetical protein